MLREEASKIISAKIECMKRENSGKDLDCNYRDCDECNLCYEQGTTGEQIEALGKAIEALSIDIIRCKDCAYSEIDDPDFPNQYFCKYHGLAWNDGEHFCSDGCLPEIMTPPQGETNEKEK